MSLLLDERLDRHGQDVGIVRKVLYGAKGDFSSTETWSSSILWR
jgi:hypothetical protein